MDIQTEYSSIEITAAVLILILLGIIFYLNWQLAMLACIVVFAAYLYVEEDDILEKLNLTVWQKGLRRHRPLRYKTCR